MKNRILISILSVISFVLIIYSSCKKEDSCVAGTGGGLTVVAQLYHGAKIIGSDSLHPDTVFVKFNAQGPPSYYTSDYDTFVVGKAGEDHMNITGLTCGDYFFFGVGLDTVSSPGTSTRVSGGTRFSTSQNTGEIKFNIPVL